ncbi:MAG TPA: plastocyanin/azurin family copper-binding protein [Gemmatimonadales bacterium]|nr:plastocyanin/azurin family copper-binding protein [Gemmatimonadales bacterium]
MRTVAIAALLAAACSSNPTGGGGGMMSGPSVSAVEYSFSPETLTVTVGATVTWTNNGTTTHTATSDAGDSLTWDSGSLAGSTPNPYGGTSPGASFSKTFTKAGVYPYHCSFHGVVGTPDYHGMVGAIKVTP